MDAEPNLGDHLISRRPGFMHHGIYVGGGRVIHYGGNAKPGISAKVEEITLERFASTTGYAIVPYRRRYSRSESVRRARSRLGEDHYCAVSNNCQHYVEWCIVGIHKSGQVSHRVGFATGAVVASGSGAIAGVAAVGGSAFAGLAVVGAAPTLAVTGLLTRTIYRQNPGQPKSERLARRVGTATTAAVGVASAVSVLGAPALSVGSLAVSTASPAIAAAAIGYGAYRVTRKLLRRVDA